MVVSAQFLNMVFRFRSANFWFHLSNTRREGNIPGEQWIQTVFAALVIDVDALIAAPVDEDTLQIDGSVGF